MDDIDRLLTEAGERWRAAEAPPPTIDPRTLTDGRPDTRSVAPIAAALGAALVLIGGLSLQSGLLSGMVGVGGEPAASLGECPVTRPDPPFIAPAPWPASPPAQYGSEWYGSAALWTMLPVDGEVWHFPRGGHGISEKSFWWTAGYSSAVDTTPGISVTGTRLDGPGSFVTDPPGTNARDDFGEAMLTGIEVPSPGCWRITGHYRDVTLSYVVLIKAD